MKEILKKYPGPALPAGERRSRVKWTNPGQQTQDMKGKYWPSSPFCPRNTEGWLSLATFNGNGECLSAFKMPHCPGVFLGRVRVTDQPVNIFTGFSHGDTVASLRKEFNTLPTESFMAHRYSKPIPIILLHKKLTASDRRSLCMHFSYVFPRPLRNKRRTGPGRSCQPATETL